MIHKALLDLIALFPSEFISSHSPSCSLQVSHTGLLFLKPSNHFSSFRASSLAGLSTCNILPTDIHVTHSLTSFKSFNAAFSDYPRLVTLSIVLFLNYCFLYHHFTYILLMLLNVCPLLPIIM